MRQPYRYRVLLLLIVIACVFPLVSAINLNFTPIFDASSDQVHINQSYKIYDQLAMSKDEFFFNVYLGIFLFLLSCILSLFPKANEVDAMIAGISTLPLFIAAISATAIDVVTGYGVTGVCEAPVGASGVCNFNEFVLLENHTIYHYDMTGIFLWILSFIAIINTIRIIINHKRIERMLGENNE